MIVQFQLHGFDCIKGFLAKLLLKMRVHIARIYNQSGNLQESFPSLWGDSKYMVSSDNDYLRFHSPSLF